MDLAHLREEYRKAELDESHVSADPFEQFGRWLQDAMDAQLKEPTAMALATATRSGAPAVRMVLLKGFDERGFTFFSNYQSRKGHELAQNSLAALCFYWAELERQVRISGEVHRTTRAESVAYFDSRPKDSRIGAAASPQSQVIGSRQELETSFAALERSGEIFCPEHWGGYRLVASEFEFWQGRRSRLHDRLRYRREDARWRIDRLAP